MITTREALMVLLVLALSPGAHSQMYSLRETTYTVKESEAHVIIEITRSGKDISLPSSVLVTTIADSATSPEDFDSLSQRREFIANSLSLTVRIDIPDDDRREGDEIFRVRISDPSNNGTINPSANEATVTIQDDDAKFNFEMSTYPLAEAVGSISIAVVRDGYLYKEADVYISTVDGTPGTDTATPDSDYTRLVRLRLRFFSGEEKITVPVRIIPDQVPEYTESLVIQIVQVDNGEIGPTSTTTLSIADDDVQYEIAEASYSVKESTGQTRVVVTITKKFNLETESTIQVYTQDGTATAVSRDYEAVLSTVRFATNQASATATVTILDDAVYEPQSEIFYVGIRDPQPSGFVLPNDERRTITIEDNESILSLASTEYTVRESDAVVVVEVRRSGDLTQQSSVRIRSISVSATANQDYTAFDLELTFASNQRGVDLRIAIADDDVSGEEDEEFIVELYQAAVSILDPDGRTSARITIQDSPRLGTLAIVLIVVGCAIFVILILIMMLCCCVFMRPNRPREPFFYDHGRRRLPGVDFLQEDSRRPPAITYIPDDLDERRRRRPALTNISDDVDHGEHHDRLDRPQRSERRIDRPSIQNGGPRITEINERERRPRRESNQEPGDQPPPPPPPQDPPAEARHVEPATSLDHHGEPSDPRRTRSMFNPRGDREPYWSKARYSYHSSPNHYGYF